MKAFLNISPEKNFQRFIDFLQPWLTTVVFSCNLVTLEMLLKLIQCLKFWILSMVIGLSLLARRGRRSWSLQEGIGPLKEEGDWRRECRRQGRHGSIRERIYNEEEDVSLAKHEIYMELLYFWLVSEWLSTPGKITIFLYLLIRASFFPKMARKRPTFCI